MLELMGRVNWAEYHLFLSQGTPSIALQLVVLNVLLLGYLMHRRIQKKGKGKAKSRPTGGVVLPMLFLVGNFGVVNWGGQLSF